MTVRRWTGNPEFFYLLHFVKPIQSQYSIWPIKREQISWNFQLSSSPTNNISTHCLLLQYYVAATAAGHNVSRKFISQTISTMANRCLETTSRRYHVYCRAIGRSKNWWGEYQSKVSWRRKLRFYSDKNMGEGMPLRPPSPEDPALNYN